MDTYFAPAQKTDPDRFEQQISLVSQSPVMAAILKIVSGLLLVMNQDRQVVAVNHGLVDSLGLGDITSVLGLRFGDIMACTYADEAPAGCGTTPRCVTCGAAIATMACIDTHEDQEEICTMTRERGGVTEDMSLLIRTRAVTIDDHRWVLFFANDITRQQIWTNMERVFFHDISNLLTGLMGNAELLSMAQPENLRVRHIRDGIRKLAGEVDLQKVFSYEKDDTYMVNAVEVSLKDIRSELALILDGHRSLRGKRLREQWPDRETLLFTDLILVSKVLGNMVLNALEATPDGGEVLIKVTEETDGVVWSVRNPGGIPDEIQQRIFQRYFSTKADVGRGLGTYSMKLFGETYLKGRVWYTTDADTTFYFKLPLEIQD
ncbi:MAG: HAMP domain-containing histidine kinase [Desulfobacterales bacterium]|nr:HAMP domain-containing histidine kinase [Desulfobacterales bacterium]